MLPVVTCACAAIAPENNAAKINPNLQDLIFQLLQFFDFVGKRETANRRLEPDSGEARSER
jgi:hypothetical protein